MPTTTINDNITLKGLDNIQDTIEIKPLEIRPLNLNTKSELAVTQPIVTNSTSKGDNTAKLNLTIDPLRVEADQRSAIDVKPLAVDACQTLKLAPLPPTCIEQPYTHHFGFTFMGVELWGFNVSGNSEMALRSPERTRFHSVRPVQHTHSGSHIHASEERPRGSGGKGGGLRVRVGQT
jgi:hypothetical protein